MTKLASVRWEKNLSKKLELRVIFKGLVAIPRLIHFSPFYAYPTSLVLSPFGILLQLLDCPGGSGLAL
jgi:hypothetical protein